MRLVDRAAAEQQLIGGHFYARKSCSRGARHRKRVALGVLFRHLCGGRIGHGAHEGLPVDEVQFLGLNRYGDAAGGKTCAVPYGDVAQSRKFGSFRRQLQQDVEVTAGAHLDHVARLTVDGNGGEAEGSIPDFRRGFL